MMLPFEESELEFANEACSSRIISCPIRPLSDLEVFNPSLVSLRTLEGVIVWYTGNADLGIEFLIHSLWDTKHELLVPVFLCTVLDLDYELHSFVIFLD